MTQSKNLWVIPTDKPSRLLKTIPKSNLILSKSITSGSHWENLHIYITSDEQIKVNDYITDGYLVWKWKDDSSLLGRKKVIITTDQDLDGVQAIDDEFLEWFVKNPSCEKVEVIKEQYHQFVGNSKLPLKPNYKIIIPNEIGFKVENGKKTETFYSKEEPKQVECPECYWKGIFDEMTNEQDIDYDQYCCPKCNNVMLNNITGKWYLEKPKQETLEKSAEKWNEKQTTLEFGKPHNAPNRIKAFIAGAKWQQEQIGKSEFLQKLRGTLSDAEARRLIFEQFKKK